MAWVDKLNSHQDDAEWKVQQAEKSIHINETKHRYSKQIDAVSRIRFEEQ